MAGDSPIQAISLLLKRDFNVTVSALLSFLMAATINMQFALFEENQAT